MLNEEQDAEYAVLPQWQRSGPTPGAPWQRRGNPAPGESCAEEATKRTSLTRMLAVAHAVAAHAGLACILLAVDYHFGGWIAEVDS